MTHICVRNLTTIGSVNGLSPGRHQVITWTNAGILLIGPLGTNFSEILIEIRIPSFKKMRLKVSSAKWRPFCLCLNVLMMHQTPWPEDITHRRLMSGGSLKPVTNTAPDKLNFRVIAYKNKGCVQQAYEDKRKVILILLEFHWNYIYVSGMFIHMKYSIIFFNNYLYQLQLLWLHENWKYLITNYDITTCTSRHQSSCGAMRLPTELGHILLKPWHCKSSGHQLLWQCRLFDTFLFI